jgi:hypothetical protein
MHILHIEHPIRDFDTWKAAFDRASGRRQQSGVRRYRVGQPTDDQNYVIIDLEFDSECEAESFLAWLRSDVWPSREAAPALMATHRRVSSRRWRARCTKPSPYSRNVGRSSLAAPT